MAEATENRRCPICGENRVQNPDDDSCLRCFWLFMVACKYLSGVTDERAHNAKVVINNLAGANAHKS